MSSIKRRVSLSRRHLENKQTNGSANESSSLKISAFDDGIVSSAEDANDALKALDKLGLPRTSSLGDSFDEMEHDSSYTEEDGAGNNSFESSSREQSLEEMFRSTSGLGYILPNGVYFEPSDDEYCSDSHSNLSLHNSPQPSHFSEYNSDLVPHINPPNSNSIISHKGEYFLQHGSNIGHRDSHDDWKIVNPDNLNRANNGEIMITDAKTDGSSGESGCDTEGTVKALSEREDESHLSEEEDPKNFECREQMESGFNEDLNLRTPSVYDEEAIINIQRDSYCEDSESDLEDAESFHKDYKPYWPQNSCNESCSSIVTGYPDTSSYASHRVESVAYPESISPSTRSSFTESDTTERRRKSKLVRRPHIKAAQSPLLKRRNQDGVEVEIERPHGDVSHTDAESDIDYQTETKNFEFESDFESIQSNIIDGIHNGSCSEIVAMDCNRNPSLVTGDVELEDSEVFTVIEKTVYQEMSLSKLSKTKEHVLKLLKERLLILKKVIQDKNSQIRHLKSRLKEEQQNSLAVLEKLKVSDLRIL